MLLVSWLQLFARRLAGRSLRSSGRRRKLPRKLTATTEQLEARTLLSAIGVADVAIVDAASSGTAINVLANDGSTIAGGLSIVEVTQPAHGTVQLLQFEGAAPEEGGYALWFVPDATYTGTVSFDYVVNDGTGETSTATVTVQQLAFESNVGSNIEDLLDQAAGAATGGSSILDNFGGSGTGTYDFGFDTSSSGTTGSGAALSSGLELSSGTGTYEGASTYQYGGTSWQPNTYSGSGDSGSGSSYSDPGSYGTSTYQSNYSSGSSSSESEPPSSGTSWPSSGSGSGSGSSSGDGDGGGTGDTGGGTGDGGSSSSGGFTLESGYAVDPHAAFNLTNVGTYSTTESDSENIDETESIEGVTYTTVGIASWTLEVEATETTTDWTYAEVYDLLVTTTTTGSDGSTAEHEFYYEYTFTAWLSDLAAGYTLTLGVGDDASGAFLETWLTSAADGGTSGGEIAWIWTDLWSDLIVLDYEEDLVEGTAAVTTSVMSNSQFAIQGAGSYWYDVPGGRVDGTSSASATDSFHLTSDVKEARDSADVWSITSGTAAATAVAATKSAFSGSGSYKHGEPESEVNGDITESGSSYEVVSQPLQDSVQAG